MLVITDEFRHIEHITKQMNDMRQKERGLSMINNGFEERSEDRRIRKTKKALRAALVRLLSKESIAEITIKELTDEADAVSYTHLDVYKRQQQFCLLSTTGNVYSSFQIPTNRSRI